MLLFNDSKRLSHYHVFGAIRVKPASADRMDQFMVNQMQPIGLLLAGGQSRRMQNSTCKYGDKALLDLGGMPMIDHVIARLAPQTSRLVINTNSDPVLYSGFGLPIVPDTIAGFNGPLAGILAGLGWSMTHYPAATHIVSASADAPFLPPDLVARLQAAVDGVPNAIAVAQSGGRLHPVIGLWPVALVDDLEAVLDAGTRKVTTWVNDHGAIGVEFPFVDIRGRRVDPFFNANTPEELAQARELLAG
jgi:molybdopterin-guanine dinucleotide biosynthesis protein A